MKTRIVRIGNSQGVRIPKPLLKHSNVQDEVVITAEVGALVIRPAKQPRANWAAAFQELARRGDDALLDEVTPSLSKWDEDHWEWRSTVSKSTWSTNLDPTVGSEIQKT